MVHIKININELLEKLRKKYGGFEVDGYYGEQCTLERAGEILFQGIGQWRTYREVWECSKRILDIKEDEKWKIKTKAKN